MGTNKNLFVTLAIAGMTGVAALISSQSGAGVLPGPKPMVLASNAPSLTIFASYTEVPRSLTTATGGKHWAVDSPLNSGIGNIRAGSNQPNWTYVPRLPHGGRRARASTISLGSYDKFGNYGPTSFNRDTALVFMHTDDNWRASDKFLGRQFRSPQTGWFNLKTEWTEPKKSEVQTEWSPSNKPQSDYRTVSEFCPLDISKEFGSTNGCGNYSKSILSVLRVMDNVINWIKSLWTGDTRSA